MPKYYYGVHKPEDSQRDNPGIPNPAPALALPLCMLPPAGWASSVPRTTLPTWSLPIILNTCWMHCTRTCKAHGLGN